MDSDSLARLIYLTLLLGAVGGYLFVEGRGRLGPALRMAAAWGLIFVGVIAAYGLWSDIRRDVLPMQSAIGADTIELPRAVDGHYYLTLTIDGTPVRFVVDTGATEVVLSRDDARSLGIDPDSLEYLGFADTANGTVRTARVTVENIALGPIRDDRMRVAVTDGEMDGSLLGMSYLGRFRRIAIENNRMILTR